MSNSELTLYRSYQEEHQFLEDALRKEAATKPLLRILEAGCGQRWGVDLSDCHIHLTGVDVDAAALKIRIAKHDDLDEAIVGDLFTIDLPPESFDVIHNAFVLEHVRDPERLLDNFLRWLRPGGLMSLKLPDRNSVKGFLTRITPYWIHVQYYRIYRKNPNAGKPGYMPYPTPFRPIVSRVGIRRFCSERGLPIVAERGRASSVDDNSLLFQSILRLGHFLSLGRLQSDYSDVDFLIRKPMTKGEVPTRSVEVLPSPRGLDR